MAGGAGSDKAPKVSELLLKRTRFGGNFTAGELFIEGRFFCYTCEDVERLVKMAGQTAIPRGRYQVIVNESPRFRRLLPRLLNVPNFSGILIHAGNTHEDTEGCILVGLTETPNGVGNSRAAMAKLMPRLEYLLKDGEVWLTIG